MLSSSETSTSSHTSTSGSSTKRWTMLIIMAVSMHVNVHMCSNNNNLEMKFGVIEYMERVLETAYAIRCCICQFLYSTLLNKLF